LKAPANSTNLSSRDPFGQQMVLDNRSTVHNSWRIDDDRNSRTQNEAYDARANQITTERSGGQNRYKQFEGVAIRSV